jgi:hypothetical protein
MTLLPLCANIGTLLGPLIGGFLAHTGSYPALLEEYPYAAPNICIATIQVIVTIVISLGLEETLDFGLGKHHDARPSGTTRREQRHKGDDDSVTDISETSRLLRHPTPNNGDSSRLHSALGFRDVWTFNVSSTMLAHFIISGHLVTFASLWAVFLSTPVESIQEQNPPFSFSGGLGMQARSVGAVMSLFGFIGIVLQITLYPTLRDRFGTIPVWRASLCLFPIVCCLAPFCALIASLASKEEKTRVPASPAVWAILLLVLILFAVGRTGVVPATSLLINDCTPHCSVRGTVHTVAVAVSNLSRSVFPMVALSVYGVGLEAGIVGVGFWFVAVLASVGCVASRWVSEGSNGI